MHALTKTQKLEACLPELVHEMIFLIFICFSSMCASDSGFAIIYAARTEDVQDCIRPNNYAAETLKGWSMGWVPAIYLVQLISKI